MFLPQVSQKSPTARRTSARLSELTQRAPSIKMAPRQARVLRGDSTRARGTLEREGVQNAWKRFWKLKM